MSGSVVERLPHSCGSRKGLNVFENEDGSYSGFCFSCSTYIPNPYDDKPEGYKPPAAFKKTAEEIEAELKAISTYKSFDLPERKLKKATLEYFNIKVGVSEEDGVTPETHYYPYYRGDVLTGYKVRHVETKRFWSMGTTKDVDLFGWKQAIGSGSKRLYICEGEIDAASLYQLLKENNRNPDYADLHPAVVSLSSGAGAAKREIARAVKEIRAHFKEVVFVFDMDKPGQDAVNEAMLILPEALSAALPAKDVNECLKEGKAKACAAAVLFNAKKPKNTRLILGESLIEQAKQPPVMGYPWPWKHLTKTTRGIRLGETVYLGAAPKMGLL